MIIMLILSNLSFPSPKLNITWSSLKQWGRSFKKNNLICLSTAKYCNNFRKESTLKWYSENFYIANSVRNSLYWSVAKYFQHLCVTLQESAAEENAVKRRGRPPGSRNKGRSTGTNAGASQQTQRRASRQRSNPKSNAAQEAVVDDPLFIDSEACDTEANGTNSTQSNENDGENYEDDDEDGRYKSVNM